MWLKKHDKNEGSGFNNGCLLLFWVSAIVATPLFFVSFSFQNYFLSSVCLLVLGIDAAVFFIAGLSSAF